MTSPAGPRVRLSLKVPVEGDVLELEEPESENREENPSGRSHFLGLRGSLSVESVEGVVSGLRVGSGYAR